MSFGMWELRAEDRTSRYPEKRDLDPKVVHGPTRRTGLRERPQDKIGPSPANGKVPSEFGGCRPTLTGGSLKDEINLKQIYGALSDDTRMWYVAPVLWLMWSLWSLRFCAETGLPQSLLTLWRSFSPRARARGGPSPRRIRRCPCRSWSVRSRLDPALHLSGHLKVFDMGTLFRDSRWSHAPSEACMQDHREVEVPIGHTIHHNCCIPLGLQ